MSSGLLSSEIACDFSFFFFRFLAQMVVNRLGTLARARSESELSQEARKSHKNPSGHTTCPTARSKFNSLAPLGHSALNLLVIIKQPQIYACSNLSGTFCLKLLINYKSFKIIMIYKKRQQLNDAALKG